MVNEIIEGVYNDVFGKEQNLSELRLQICKKCPLYKKDSILGAICNNKLYVDLKTGKTSRKYIKGYMNGCGCILRLKTKSKKSKCPIGKW